MSELKTKVEETTANLGMPCGMGIPMQDWAIDDIISLVKAEIVEAVEQLNNKCCTTEAIYGYTSAKNDAIKAIQEVK